MCQVWVESGRGRLRKASGQLQGEGLTLLEVAEKFAKEEARAWIEELRWPDGPSCPHCGSTNVQCNIRRQNRGTVAESV